MLSIESVTKKYVRRTALSDLTTQFESGRTYALLGPNGSGKTTLMKLICGLTRPDSGRILLDGAPIGPEDRARIAYCPTENYFYRYMTAMDAGRWYRDFFEDFSMKTYLARLERMELPAGQKIQAMSSGMAAKLRVALALSRNAQWTLLDEPLNGVDILARAQVIEAIDASRGDGRGLIVSTHLVDELAGRIDRALFLKNGQLVAQQETQGLPEGGLTERYLSIYAGATAGEEALRA